MKSKMMHINAGLISVAILICLIYYLNMWLQPTAFTIEGAEKQGVVYINPDTTYYLKGEMDCYPGVFISPEEAKAENALMRLEDPEEIRSDACRVDDVYQATLCFHLDLPGGADYALLMPGEFCQYSVYVNGENLYTYASFHTDSYIYPAKAVVELPANKTGEYDILLHVITPVNSTHSTSTAILLGTSDQIHEIYDVTAASSIYMMAVILVTILFTFIQYLSIRHDKTITSFLLLSLAIMVRLAFTGNVIILTYLPELPYQIGIIIRSLTMPLLMLAMINHMYCMFPGLFPKKITIVVLALEAIPVIDTLTLQKIPGFSIASDIAYVAAFALCYYVIAMAHIRKYEGAILFSIGILVFSVTAVLELVTGSMPVPIMFPEFYPFISFAIMELLILARRYAEQRSHELSVSEELSRTLETMQAQESAFLNAQMKPHFLYNTLNTIADLCVSDPDKAKSLIDTLKDYVRRILAIDNMERTVSLTDEMELVTAYAKIEKERFPSINFYTDLPIRMPRINMPPLTLQPLIENAIKHGVRKSEGPGAITLRLRDSIDSVTFYVSDNGAGMTQETIDKLFEQPKENKSIGVYNIDKRLKNLYGKGLEVTSTVGLGTCVSFTIPK